MFRQNPLTNCDSYKLGHMAQYPKGTEFVYSNFTPRSDAYLNVPPEYKTGQIVFFGIQAVVKELVALWDKEFFSQPIDPIVEAFGMRIAPFVGPSGFDLNKIRELHAYGKLPIIVKALPEGSRVNIGVPVVLVMNTKPEFYWITNFLETWLSCELWKMSTSATIADVYKRILTKYAIKTGSPLDFVLWQGHDFSMRGMGGVVDAAKSGAAHLLSFTGTDCLPAVDFLEQFYHGKETFVGGSVPATEHSVMCMGGEEDELETFRRLIEDVYPAGIVSIVSDTWDFWQVITSYAPALKAKILARKQDAFGNAKVVFRPDSGDPVRILTGYRAVEVPDLGDHALFVAEADPHFEGVVKYKDKYFKVKRVYGDWADSFERKQIEACVVKGAVETLWDIFGGTMTANGFKMLNPRVGLIYGDSITPQRCDAIMQRLVAKGFASCNVVLGIGSFTYQYNTRDTLGFALKATYGVVEGTGRAIYKNPKTDDGIKRSAKGLLKVVKDGDRYVLIDNVKSVDDSGELTTLFNDGEFTKDDNLASIRARLLAGVAHV